MATFKLTGPGGGNLAKSLRRQFNERVRHKIIQAVAGGGGKSANMSSGKSGPTVTALRRIANKTLKRSAKNLRRDWKVQKQSSIFREALAKSTNQNGLRFFLPMDRKAVEAGVQSVLNSQRISSRQSGKTMSIRFGFTSSNAAALEKGAVTTSIDKLPKFEHERNKRPFAAWLDTFPETRSGVSTFFTEALGKHGRKSRAVNEVMMKELVKVFRSQLRKRLTRTGK